MGKISGYIDRFEGDKAVIYLGEDLQKVNLPKCYLPKELDLNEGDYINLEITFDKDKTEAALNEAMELMK